MRMKLEPPPITFNSFDSACISRTTSLAGRSYVSDTPLPPTETPQTIEEESPDPQPHQETTNGAANTASLMAAQAGPDLGLGYEVKHTEPQRTSAARDHDSRQKQGPPPEQESPVIPHRLYAEAVRIEDIPAEPLDNPWQPTAQPTVTVDANPTRPPPDRRRRVSSEDSGRPYTPPFVVSNAFGEPNGPQSRPRRLDEGVTALMLEELAQEARVAEQNTAESRTERIANGDQRPSAGSTPPLPSPLRPLPSPPIPSPVATADMRTASSTTITGIPGGPPTAAAAQPVPRVLSSQRYSETSSTNSGRSSVFDLGARDSMVSPVTDNRVSVHDDHNLSPVRTESYTSIPEDRPVMSAGWASTTSKPLAVRPGPSPQPTNSRFHLPSRAQADIHPFSREQSGDQPGLIVAQNAEEQPGLEPVLSGDGSAPGAGGGQPSIVLREPNCAITVDSSFYQLKGFCDGAKDIIRGGVGVKKVRKGVSTSCTYQILGRGLTRRQGIGAANTLVAKCMNKSCMFELEWKSVEADVNMEGRGLTVHIRCPFSLLTTHQNKPTTATAASASASASSPNRTSRRATSTTTSTGASSASSWAAPRKSPTRRSFPTRRRCSPTSRGTRGPSPPSRGSP